MRLQLLSMLACIACMAPLCQGKRLSFEDLPGMSQKLSAKAAHLSKEAKQKFQTTLHKQFFPEEDAEYMDVDSTGQILYIDPAHKDVQKAEASRRTAVDVTPDRYLSNGLPVYHSKQGAQNIIFLDFDGHENPSNNAWGAFSAKPFNPSNNDQSSSNPTFSSNEATEIGYIWQRIAEDFAPFNVDVTTEQPSSMTSTTCHLLITSSTQVGGQNMPAHDAGGVAYVDVFGTSYYDYYSPALVFYDNLGSVSDNIAEASSHEIGHNLGLSHDGKGSLTYYGGDANGAADSWGPIMGTGYGNGVSQWSKGEYTDATNVEDDLAIIAQDLGYRSDDHGNAKASATSLQVDNSGDFEVSGIIERNNDVDVFAVTVTSPSTLTIEVSPLVLATRTRGHNLDAGLKLYSSDGSLIATAEPSRQLDADIEAQVNNGQYFIHVYGTGHGTSKYSDYGSLGHYDLVGRVEPTGEPPRTTTSGQETTTVQRTTSDEPGTEEPETDEPETRPFSTTWVQTTTDFTTSEPCFNDDFEDNDRINKATRISAGQTYSSLTLCQDDVDVFRFTPSCRNGRYLVTTTFDHDALDIDMTIYRNNGNREVTSSLSFSDTETVEFVYSFKGDVWISIFSFHDGAAPYTMSINEVCPTTTTRASRRRRRNSGGGGRRRRRNGGGGSSGGRRRRRNRF